MTEESTRTGWTRWLPRRKRSQLLLVLVIVLSALVTRASVAPLNVPFGSALAERVTGGAMAVNVGAVAVQLGAGRLHFLLRDVRAVGDKASVSAGAIRFSQGFEGRSVTVEAPVVRLDPSGGEGGEMPTPEVALVRLRDALDQAAAAVEQADLLSVSIANGRLDVIAAGRPISEARVFRALEARLSTGENGALSAEGSLIGVGGRVTFGLERTLVEGEQTLVFEADGIVPLDLAPIQPVQSGFPLSPKFHATWDREGTPQTADLYVAIGRGIVKFGRDPTRELDSASVSMSWRTGDPDIAVDEIAVLAGGTSMTITGAVTPVAGEPWLWSMATRDAFFNAPDFDGPPVAVTRIEAEGRIDFANKLVHVDRGAGFMPTGRADAVMTFDLGEGGPWVSGAAEVGASTIPSLLAAWIPVMGYEPRIAVMSTVLGGILEDASLTFALSKPDFDGDPTTHSTIEGAMSVDASFVDATLSAPELPLAIQRAKGSLRIRDKRLRAIIRSGIIEVGGDPADVDAPGDIIIVEEGRFTIDRMDEKPVIGRATLNVRAPMSAAVRLANLFGVDDISGTPITPDDVFGMFRAKLTLRSPLGPDVPMSARAWSVEARLVNAASKVPIGGQTFSDANVEVAINARRLAARGRALIDGLTVDVNYSELFAGRRSGAARIVLTDADRRAKGFDTGELVQGPVVVTIEAGDGDERLLTADLTEAKIALPGLLKDEGEALSAEAVAVIADGTTTVSDIKIDGGGVDVAGSLTLAGTSLREAEFDRVALSPGDSARASIDQRDGLYRVSATARSFDARPLIASLQDGLAGSGGDDDDDADGLDLSVEVTADRVQIQNASVLTDLSVNALRRDGKMERFTASGRINGNNSGSFGVTFGEDAGRQRLRADVASLGELLSSLDIYDRLREGRTRLEATLGDDEVLRGRLTAGSFVIENERALDDLVRRAQENKIGALERNVQPSALQDGTSIENGIPFDELIVDFERRGSTIVIQEAILRGPVMGGTAEGVVDLGAGLMRLNGTFIPAYGVNNLFGRLPIVGGILGGGNKGGLIGVTFRLAGPLGNPRVSVNPISAIAPGIFRRIFEFR